MLRKILIICILICLILPTYQAAAVYDQEIVADQIWEYLVEETQNEIIAAGIMGYFQRESNLKADAIPNWFIHNNYDMCTEFTQELNGLEKIEFVNKIQQVGGYGLGQWYSTIYLKDFYNWCLVYGYNYDSIEGQCKFIVYELSFNKELWEKIKDAETAYDVGFLIGCYYDGASELGRYTIAEMSEIIYKE